jgi:hypothetical protein
MSVLFLGLSGAVMIGSNAIPTATQTGISDQTVIDALNQFRTESRQATGIQYRSSAAGEQLTFDLKDTGQAGTPSRIRYQYVIDSHSFTRIEIGQVEKTLFANISGFGMNIIQDGTDATVLWIVFVVDDTIQKFFEIHVALPDKPGLI